MDFGVALTALKQGHCATRAGWNGRGMFIYMVPGSQFVVNRAPMLGIYPPGTEITYLPHLDMRTVNGACVPWLASQTDILAEDWEPYVPVVIDENRKAPESVVAAAAAPARRMFRDNPTQPVIQAPKHLLPALQKQASAPLAGLSASSPSVKRSLDDWNTARAAQLAAVMPSTASKKPWRKRFMEILFGWRYNK